MRKGISFLPVIRSKDFQLTRPEWGLILILQLGLELIFGILFFNTWWSGIIFYPFFVHISKGVATTLKERKDAREEKIFAEAIEIIKNACEAGYSCENAFIEAGVKLKEMHPASRMTRAFSEGGERLKRNESMESAIRNTAGLRESEDKKIFFDIFCTAYRQGGDVSEIISDTVEHIKLRNEINKEVKSMISGKRFEQRIMCFMPFFIIAYLRLTSDLLDGMYGNITGVVVMAVCAALYMVAFILAEKIVGFKV